MLSLWQMSLSASAVILLTALLRRFAANRLPRRMYIALWDVALLASIVPFRVPWEALSRLIQRMKVTVPQADGAVFSIPTQAPQLAQGAAMSLPQSVTAAVPTVAPMISDGVRDSLTQAVQPLRETVRSAPAWLWQALGAVWLIGAVVLACVLAYRWLSCRRVFSEALPCEDQRAVAFLREHRLLRRVRVRVSGRIASPLSYGLLRPVILLPAAMAGADDQTMRYVLTHEFMHIRALDMLRKSALLFALCLHWYNPLAWVMLRLCNRDMELMCDERVVRRLGGRKAYCLTLLDIEVRRSDLTMGTCFSVTGIEERIKVMKNRKHQGILSIVLAIAIFLGAATGAMTGMPWADAEGASPRMMFSPETWESTYAKYEVYGLDYDGKNGTITYHGQAVRYFEDMWPIDETGKAGACFIYEGGTVDVYGVREYGEVIRRNPDGSFDPSGTLVGLRQATQEEYDAMTARLGNGIVSDTTLGVLQTAEDVGIVYTMIGNVSIPDDPSATPAPVAYAKLDPASPFLYGVPYADVEWWTAEEYRAWMEEERVALQQLVEEQAQSWTPSKGWFIWTQEEADAAMARYESMLQAIEQGALVSKSINGEDARMTLTQGLGDGVFVNSTTMAVLDGTDATPSVEGEPDSTVEDFVFTGFDSQTVRYGTEANLGGAAEGRVVLVAVGPEDAWRYTPEEWAVIMEMVEQGLIRWQEPEATDATPAPVIGGSQTIPYRLEPDGSETQITVISVPVGADDARRYTPEQWTVIQELIGQGATQYWSPIEGTVIYAAIGPDNAWRYTPEQWTVIQELIGQGAKQWRASASIMAGMDDQNDQITRREAWREAISPYEPFGLSFVHETVKDTVRLYWNGREVRGVFDPERGVWITDHAGNSGYPEGARELIAVYEDGVLVGLREANDEENAIWDGLRGGNE